MMSHCQFTADYKLIAGIVTDIQAFADLHGFVTIFRYKLPSPFHFHEHSIFDDKSCGYVNYEGFLTGYIVT